jgi:hypothetical protein
MNIYPDLSDDDLSSAMGTETPLPHYLVPEGLPACSKGSAEQQIHHIEGEGARYLVVDQSANWRHNSKVSKIWQDGMEVRALGVLASVVEQWFDQKALDEGNIVRFLGVVRWMIPTVYVLSGLRDDTYRYKTFHRPGVLS